MTKINCNGLDFRLGGINVTKVQTIRHEDKSLSMSNTIYWISNKTITVKQVESRGFETRRGHNSNFYSTPHSRGGRIINTDQSCNN